MEIKYRRWLHFLAILTVLTALPLLLLGAEVTSRHVGMVDPQGLRFPWHIALVHNLREHGVGYIIEHSHRVFGWLVGLCAIGLAIGFWRTEKPGRARRWLGIVALGAVLLQGVLGILRVSLNSLSGPEFAFIHGCVAQIVFAFLVAVAVVASRSWLTPSEPLRPEAIQPLWRWSLYAAAVVFIQILLGAVVRRTFVPWGPRLHVLFAFAVFGVILALAKTALDSPGRDRALIRSVIVLCGLVVLQLALGMETWLSKFWIPELQTHEISSQLRPLAMHGEGIRSLHYLIGSFLFATTVAVAVRAHRRLSWSTSAVVEPVGRLEGVA